MAKKEAMATKKSIVCPIEDVESEKFASWLRDNGIMGGHIPNETPTKRRTVVGGRVVWSGGWATNAKNKRKGVVRGIPDFIVVLSSVILFIEMKRQNGVPSDVKPEQKEWIAALDLVDNVHATVAYGADEAIAYVKRFL